MSNQTIEFVLDAEGIDEASERIAAFLERAKVDRRSALSTRLTFESALIRLSEHFGEDTPATLTVGNRLGRPRLRVKVRGERFDPRELRQEPDWERLLRENAGLDPAFAYRGGHNTLTLACPRPSLGLPTRTLIAIVLGALLARMGLSLSDGVRQSLLDGLIMPLFDTFVGVLAGIAGPMVFLSVAWGICGIGDIAALGRSGKALIGRFLRFDAMATLVGLLVCLPVFKLPAGTAQGEGGQLASVVQTLLDLVPTNLVKPFVEGNTLQIIVLAVAVGTISLVLGDVTEDIRKLLREFNALLHFLMEQVCRLLPAFIVVMVIAQTWSGNLGALLSCWLPVALVCVMTALLYLARLVAVAAHCQVSPGRLFKAYLPTLMLAFMTASSSAAYGSMSSTTEDDLGVSEEHASFGIPLGLVLCKPSQCVLLLALMLYSAQSYGLAVDTFWYVRLGLSSFLYSVAVPPVPGGMIACYGMLLASLGIPVQALAVVTALDLLLDYPTTAGNVGDVMLEVLDAANALDAVDHERLNR